MSGVQTDPDRDGQLAELRKQERRAVLARSPVTTATLRRVLYALIDSCVWLDLAKHIDGQKLIAAMRVLVHEDRLTLLVPDVVVAEYERNQARVEADMTRSMSAHFRRVRDAIDEHGQGEGREAAITELDNVTHRLPLINEMATRNFADILDLLMAGQKLSPTSDGHERVVRRALEKKAPFHRSKNSVADALLVEMYATFVALPAADPSDEHCFVSSNVKDFSAPDADDRLPHPDIADMFAGLRSHYFRSVSAGLAARFPDEFDELLEEFDVHEEPRSYEEIRDAEDELFDRIWYDRSMALEPRGEDGERYKETAGPARAKVEAKYGIEKLGPYEDFDWGMLNGKLSALRWVLGSEWDFLDT